MRPLYWTRIVTPVIPTMPDFTQPSAAESNNIPPAQLNGETPADTPATPAAATEPEDKAAQILWMQIRETELENIDEFGDLFSRQTVQKKDTNRPEVARKKKVVKAKVLDSKRSQNIGIIVKSMHVDFAEVENAIYNCDTSVVSLEVLQQILEIRASADELSAIEELQRQEGVVMDEPETFLLKLSRVSYFMERISCLVFQTEFEEAASGFQRKLDVLSDVCNFLVTNENIRQLFSIILTFGNYMNGGNRQRGQADGFGLDILPKLKDVKSNDTRVTLLHYIVHTYVKHSRATGTSLMDLESPLPSKYDIEKCNNIDFDDLQAQLKSLRTRLTDCEQRIVEVQEKATEVATFKLKMGSFVTEADHKLVKLDTELGGCRTLFQRTIEFYKFHTRNNEKVERPGQFFDLWTQFTVDFEDIWRRHLNELKQEL